MAANTKIQAKQYEYVCRKCILTKLWQYNNLSPCRLKIMVPTHTDPLGYPKGCALYHNIEPQWQLLNDDMFRRFRRSKSDG